MFDRGIIEFLIILIFSSILFFSNSLDINYESNIIYIILIKVGYTIIYFIKAFCLMKVIYIFTSQYVSFLVTSESVAATINLYINYINRSSFQEKEYEYYEFYGKIYFIFEFLSLFIIIFGTLLYNEMIVITICGLDENTKKGLYFKGMNDLFITINELGDNEDDEEEDEDEDNNNSNHDINDDKKNKKSKKKEQNIELKSSYE